MRIDPATSRRLRRPHLVGLVALLALTAGLLSSPTAASATDPAWVEGKSDSDTVLHCINQTPATGVLASVAWRPAGRAVPRIGERFYVRMTAAMVGPSCNGVAMLAEMLAPRGMIYGDDARHPVRWGIRNIDDPVSLRTGGLAYHPGSNGGVLLTQAGDKPFILQRGQVLEIDVPVISTRVMKGKATREPECENRRNGIAPCPVTEAGDHFQAAFRVGGHGGNKTYVTPYVGIFAQAAASRTGAAYTVSSRVGGHEKLPGDGHETARWRT